MLPYTSIIEIMEKKISVVIPTRNNTNSLLKCLAALTRQTVPYSYFEVIVVSDGLDQELANVLNIWQYSHQMDLRFLQTPSVKGKANAWSFGRQNARGEVVTFAKDESIPDRNWLNSILHSSHKQKATAYTGKTIVPFASSSITNSLSRISKNA